MSKIQLKLGDRYTTIGIEAGALLHVGRFLHEMGFHDRLLVLTDGNVRQYHSESLLRSLRSAGFLPELVVIPTGEISKSQDQLFKLYDRLSQLHWRRDEPILALGGGVVSDLAGYLAATWLRGVPWVICPTTLEADVDACIGGKCGINHPAGKNLIGAFHQPKLVLIDPLCLKTLPDRDHRAGLAESVKHAAIRDEAFFRWHETHRAKILDRDPETLAELIERNVRIKGKIVQADERETTGERMLLNFGHTIGHALEAHSEFTLRHGECVSLGMVAAARISEQAAGLPIQESARLRELLSTFSLPTAWSGPALDVEKVLAYMRQDKKTRSGRAHFVLLERLGSAVVRDDVPDEVVREAIEQLNK